jgi:hypothetical protein
MTIVTRYNNTMPPLPPTKLETYIPKYRSASPPLLTKLVPGSAESLRASVPKSIPVIGTGRLLNCLGPETSPFGVRFVASSCDKHHIGWFA